MKEQVAATSTDLRLCYRPRQQPRTTVDWFRDTGSLSRCRQWLYRSLPEPSRRATVPTTNDHDPHADNRRLLTVPEACAQLRVSRWTLYQLIRRRQLRTLRIGSRRLVPTEAIADLIEQLGREEAF